MKEWYQKDNEEIIKELESSVDGLTGDEAVRRLSVYGLNELYKKEKDSIIKIFFSEFKDPIIYLLIAAIILSFFIGEYVDGIAIIVIILIDAIIGTIQEWKANESAEALQNLIKVKTLVLRNGEQKLIDASNVVPGDIVLVESGTKVSADLRIIESRNLTADESILTGESINSVKNSDVISDEVPLADQRNMLFAGTSIITGRATCIAVGTSQNTEIGKIANKVNETVSSLSPLEIRMNKFSKQITVTIGIISVIIAILLFIKGVNIETILLSVIALGVSAMPEGLPLALTMALTIGSNRMSKKNVIVKKLNSVESLGSCTVIASDKTGTLTVNQQTAKKILLPDNSEYDIDGIGYNDNGNIKPKDNANLDYAQELSILGVLNNEAGLHKEKNGWRYFGDSIDVAFLALGMKLGVDKSSYKITGIIPYESEAKYSAVSYIKEKEHFCTVKGSLEKVLSFCKNMKVNDKLVKLDSAAIEKQNTRLAKEGYRVIALASGNYEDKDELKEENIKDLTFIGLVGFIDPIREETKNAISECKNAGIKTVMITGDHPLTAFAIAKDLNLATDYSEVTNSIEIDEYLKKGHKAFDKFIKDKVVFTRVTPIQKLEIVESFIRQGEYIAVTGDGVNDAPAIKAANIGIAMGSGTDVAKETADMIITDDNFNSIVEGIKEGRNAYSNIRKIVYFLISCGFAEVLFFVLSIICGLPIPLVAIQLLWLNVVTDGLQDLALSFEVAEDGIMRESNADKKDIFNSQLIGEILLSATYIGLLVFGVWYILINKMHMDVAVARGHIMALMVFVQNIHVLNCRSEKQSIFKIKFFKNPIVFLSISISIGLQILVMEVEPLSKLLSTTSIPVDIMLKLLMLALPIIILMETYKLIRRKVSCKN